MDKSLFTKLKTEDDALFAREAVEALDRLGGKTGEEFVEYACDVVLFVKALLEADKNCAASVLLSTNSLSALAEYILRQVEAKESVPMNLLGDFLFILGDLCQHENPELTDLAVDRLNIFGLYKTILKTYVLSYDTVLSFYWTMSNICSGTDSQCAKVFENAWVVSSIEKCVANACLPSQLRREAWMAFANMVIREIHVIRQYALQARQIDVLFEAETFELSGLLEALLIVLYERDLPSMPKDKLYEKVNKLDLYRKIKFAQPSAPKLLKLVDYMDNDVFINKPMLLN